MARMAEGFGLLNDKAEPHLGSHLLWESGALDQMERLRHSFPAPPSLSCTQFGCCFVWNDDDDAQHLALAVLGVESGLGFSVFVVLLTLSLCL
jgi:hypothetical protein